MTGTNETYRIRFGGAGPMESRLLVRLPLTIDKFHFHDHVACDADGVLVLCSVSEHTILKGVHRSKYVNILQDFLCLKLNIHFGENLYYLVFRTTNCTGVISLHMILLVQEVTHLNVRSKYSVQNKRRRF